MKIKYFIIGLCLILFPNLCYGGMERLQVSFIAVSSQEEPFWGNIVSMAQAAAEDLNIDLEVLYAERSHLKAIQLAEKISKRKNKPDYVIVVGEKKIGGVSLALLDEAGIKSMLFGELVEAERQLYGNPRQKLKTWIGQRKINDFDMGRKTSRALIKTAFTKELIDDKGILNILALGGVFATPFSEDRIKGLKDVVAENDKVVVLQIVPTDWNFEDGEYITSGLLRRYHQIGVGKIGAIWCANSDLALGAIEAVKKIGLEPGKDILFSGIDWHQDAYNAIQNGSLLTASGGHFTEIAWMLVMLYDYHHGVDFMHTESMGTCFQLNRKNLPSNLPYIEPNQWHLIDFKQFSKVLNPKIESYNFNFSEVVKQLSSTSPRSQ